MKTVERLADVWRSNGTIAGVAADDGYLVDRHCRTRRRRSARRCVRAPCPMSDVPAYAITLPSNRNRTVAWESPVVAPDLIATAMPRPRPATDGFGPSRSSPPRARGTAPTGRRPERHRGRPPRRSAARLTRRISSAVEPERRAPASICDSIAQATCGVPKPRNAALGVVFERTARATIRARSGCGMGRRPT